MTTMTNGPHSAPNSSSAASSTPAPTWWRRSGVTGVAKKSGATVTVENLWLFEIAEGNFVRAQLYADTAAARNV